ncbi:endonuclease/exonuclease/phosphatase family protein [Streptomyces sp. NBC_01637]|uniref:endonuclease/exonuclease/phosphatase family protein n=1 Tax=unclassified Streptomyces TaxID=2593676 RepID=UPI00386CD46F|nr:endonuclease/exonuclease/phosphatase family protein [Streptomyces sp. NBC_01653]WTD33125.1 endonuclease/exonuclease/phosphatase family protein [Streptomyces sp. NBC_01643]WTD88607.1 endonuclease/exonuclease/phosphatase family protein [Streptomyces sp. NBC_01637]
MVQAYRADTENGSAEPQRTGSRFQGLRDRWTDGRGLWRRGIVLAVCAVLLTLVTIFHAEIPNTIGNLGSLSETFLPWFGLFIPVLLVLGLVRRSATALIALLLPVVVWLNIFGGLLTDKSGSGGDLTVATHNVNADNPDPAGTARQVAGSGADVIALQELPPGQVPAYESALAARYPYHSVEGTVGLWSKYPMSGTRPVDIRMGWTRAMRSTVTTPDGEVAVYVAHMPSVRVKLNAGFTASQRDESADALGEAIADERLDRVILLGDLNGTMNDRSLNAVTSQMRSTQGAAGDGFGFSWPASFPMARIDQIMVKGVEPMSSWTLPATDSDHLPIAARVAL